MSREAVEWAIQADARKYDLTPSEHHTLIALCVFAQNLSGVHIANYPREDYAAYTGLNIRTLQRTIISLEERGLVRRHETYVEGRRGRRPDEIELRFL